MLSSVWAGQHQNAGQNIQHKIELELEWFIFHCYWLQLRLRKII